ncbi:HAD-IIIC family phosphatase [Streptomyces sp. HUAS TT20]|uniref:HAD-IIIC family phosphatase n=1 Tax=Streptomyces sp. HUAS TT20 TaxID=3447509 RepID=UPI0021DA1C60|nr:HAD-IIIC family phosphatase [Streptomyces sp. HUAS 15-9]UXY30507.1 HAD-IIIC family phosphatase [Streptomyces sp. HUAS 15-9]
MAVPVRMTTRGEPLERLRDLAAQGRLETAYDEVVPLLAELADDPEPPPGWARRAGRLLGRADRDAVLARHPHLAQVTVAVTGQSTVADVVEPLTGELARHGLLLHPVVGDHGAYLRDLTDPMGAFRGLDADLALCLLDDTTVFAEVPAVWGPDDVERAADEVAARLEGLVRQRARTGAATLALNTLPLPRERTHQLVDHHSRARLGVLWREFNARLLRLGAEEPGVVVIDLDPLLAASGPVADTRLAQYASARIGAGLLDAYAREVAHLVRALTGRTRKCLVLDLDHTLWDGVLGDDGPDGIAAAGTLRGEAFGVFQRAVRQLAAQGVLLAVSSKNERGAVLDALRTHPDLALREGDFTAVHADWEPKSGHLAAVAEALGIGDDALVFADDSPAERAEVRHSGVRAAVVPLDDEPALHLQRLLIDGWFDTLTVTAEDRARAGHHRAAGARAALRAGSGSHEEFLRGLDITVDLSEPWAHELARLAQLTQRTNQFNLTGMRLTPSGAAAAVADADRLLLAARTADRFGENGLTGALLATREGDELRVDNTWLSCRVLARGIEQALLAVVLAHARDRGHRAVLAAFRPTPKNHRARDFYPSLGFTPAGERDGALQFRHDLRRLPVPPEHVRITGPLTTGPDGRKHT